jgi:hypothetical protein
MFLGVKKYMAHYAFLNEHNIVTEVIVGKNENEEGIDWEKRYEEIRGQKCLRTSYNTHSGVHSEGGTPFRKNYAGIGYTYDTLRDAFIPPKSFNSWIFNEEKCNWDPPTPMPEDAGTGTPRKEYKWDEITLSWVDVTPTE